MSLKLLSKSNTYLECGSCGTYHPIEFFGDCRNDANRFSLEELPDKCEVITLEEQESKI